MAVITISRETGSMGDEIAIGLSDRLGIRLITHDYVMYNWLPGVANEYELHMLEESPRFYLNKCSSGISFSEYIELRLKEEIAKEPLLIQGLGSQIIFTQYPEALNVRIIASDVIRKQRLVDKYGLSISEAERTIELSDRRHRRYISLIYGKDWSVPSLYDISLNTDNISVDEAVEFLSGIYKYRQSLSEVMSDQPAQQAGKQSGRQSNIAKSHTFVHPSEEEFSKILDMYNIQWEYEPKTFPIEWDAEGNVKMAFTPDFYLPRFNTYIELTTMEQKYVTEKNKKVRRLKEIHPEININIVFKKDFHTLIKRFGIAHTQNDKN